MRIPEFGKYAVVVHYYQSKHQPFKARATVTANRAYQGYAEFKYCPNLSGCRVALKNNDATNLFDIERLTATLQMEIPGGSSVWIVSMIPLGRNQLLWLCCLHIQKYKWWSTVWEDRDTS